MIRKTLADLIQDYIDSYVNNNHQLTKVKIGGRIPHEFQNQDKLPWQVFSTEFLIE